MKKLRNWFKNLFNNIASWFKPKAVEKTETVDKTEPTTEETIWKTRVLLLFERLREQGLMEPPEDFLSENRVKELQESARKYNEFRDMRNKLIGFNKPSEELKGQMLSDLAKDKTLLKRQYIAVKEMPEAEKSDNGISVGYSTGDIPALREVLTSSLSKEERDLAKKKKMQGKAVMSVMDEMRKARNEEDNRPITEAEKKELEAIKKIRSMFLDNKK